MCGPETMVRRSNIYYSKICKIYLVKVEQRTFNFRLLSQIPIWKGAQGISGIDTQLSSLKIKWIQRLLNPTNALSEDLTLYLLKLTLESKPRLDAILFGQTQVVRSTRHKNLKIKQ